MNASMKYVNDASDCQFIAETWCDTCARFENAYRLNARLSIAAME